MYNFKEYEEEFDMLLNTLKDFNEVGFSEDEIHYLMRK